MKIPKRLVLLALLLFLAVEPGHTTTLVVQKEISVSRALVGQVLVRGTDEPAGGVKVQLCGPDWKTALTSTITDENGYFSLEKPATGKLFYVRVSAPGMDIYELRVRVTMQAAQDLVIRLSVATLTAERPPQANGRRLGIPAKLNAFFEGKPNGIPG